MTKRIRLVVALCVAINEANDDGRVLGNSSQGNEAVSALPDSPLRMYHSQELGPLAKLVIPQPSRSPRRKSHHSLRAPCTRQAARHWGKDGFENLLPGLARLLAT